MPQIHRGEMWDAYDDADLFLITTNASLKQNGALVMGRGIVRQARDRFLVLDLALGREIATVWATWATITFWSACVGRQPCWAPSGSRSIMLGQRRPRSSDIARSRSLSGARTIRMQPFA